MPVQVRSHATAWLVHVIQRKYNSNTEIAKRNVYTYPVVLNKISRKLELDLLLPCFTPRVNKDKKTPPCEVNTIDKISVECKWIYLAFVG